MCHAFLHTVNIHPKAPAYTSALKIRIYCDIYLIEKKTVILLSLVTKCSQMRKMGSRSLDQNLDRVAIRIMYSPI